MSNARLDLLRRHLDQAFRGPSWHGPNLLGALRGLGPEEAAWRPGAGRHNAWETAVHAAYWKYRVWARLLEAPAGSFDLKGSDWFPRPEASTRTALKRDLELLRSWHGRLLEAVGALDPQRLDERPGRSEHTYEGQILGVACHDVYHAGQIRLLRRLQAQS